MAAGQYDHIYSGDPALDRDAEGFDHAQYVAMKDEARLRIREGCQAVRFRLRHVSAAELQYLKDVGNRRGAHSMAYEAVALGLTDIVPFVTDGGEQLKFARTPDPNGFLKVEPSLMGVLLAADDGQLLYELGNRIIEEDMGRPT
jgi:hypothetical protein